ncbi:septum formation protein [Galdieria sulphuraria]|uniref:Septum formation protein n=1 Tax=Galdieria sulphuraria TaxID=130081 RepID=M2Y3K3_GALSU|nr:septum formation protein [Galdieria sulphuraria]EME30389.1 septum formation protein [Galdieria sulphuraria]|eukprot:XP_005706909.1 septum formation protein [Galdieria sulphuraria]
MLIQYLPRLENKRIILASRSPRRQEILRLLKLPFEVFPSSFPENFDPLRYSSPTVYSVENAKNKALDILERLCTERKQDSDIDLVIGADTVVEIDGQVLEKPESEASAVEMLQLLSGRKHLVHSGVCLYWKSCKSNWSLITFSETTEVEMARISSLEILAYVKTGEPMDKSGAYGIQGIGGSFVKSIHGCYFNVMGLPMHHLARKIAQLCEEKNF